MKRCFALLIVALPAIAAAQSAPTPTATAAPSTPEKKICRRMETTGSIMGTRECHTKSEWAAMAEANSAATEEALARRSRSLSRQ